MSMLQDLAEYFKPDERAPEYYVKDSNKLFQQGEKSCVKRLLEKTFNTQIPCDKFYSIISGEGKEEEKIDTFYSSSLQTLLFFSSISESKPLTYDGVTYSEVYFEVKNRVIGYPSSVDAVLVGKSKDGKNTVLFIETKLCEVIRDSSPIGKAEIGKSYFMGSKSNSYCNRFFTDGEDMKAIGIDRNAPAPKSGNYIVSPIGGAKYVYSYGMKQLLSHIIGIMNFKENGTINYPMIDRTAEVRFLTLINALPGYNKSDSEKKTTDFIRHYNVVIEYLRGKPQCQSITMYNCSTFQDFYSEVKQSGYNLGEKIVKYYHYEK